VPCNEITGRVHYVLDRDPKNAKSDDTWHTLLGSPKGAVRNVKVSVGPNESTVYPTNTSFNLFIIPIPMLILFIVFFTVTLTIFLRLSRTPRIIRSPAVAPPGAMPPSGLPRFQLAFWFFLATSVNLFF